MLVGSLALSLETPGSDVDIVYLALKNTTTEDRFKSFFFLRGAMSQSDVAWTL